MIELKQYIVDAFTEKLFHGNQASERSGELLYGIKEDRVVIMGKAVLYSEAELHLPE